MKYLYSSFKPLLVILFTALAIGANAQSLGKYDFLAGTTCGTQVATAPAANLSFSTITASTVSCSVAGGSQTLSAPVSWPANSVAALAGSTYIEFTLTPAIGYEVTVNSVSIRTMRDAGGPRSLAIAYNAGSGYLGNSTIISTLGVTTTTKLFNADLSAPVTSGNPVSFRIYGYSPQSSTALRALITDYIELQGSVAIAQPTVQSTIAITATSLNSLDLSFSGGDGSNRIVLAQEGSPVAEPPADFTTYTADPVFGASPDQIGSAFPVYIGSGNSVTVTGLSPATQYYFAVYEFNEIGAGTENYLEANPGETSGFTARGIYTWSGGASGSWTDPLNWTPNRLAPALDGSDSLIFATAGTVTITDVVDELIGGLTFWNNTHVILSSSAPALVDVVDFSSSQELYIEAGSTLELNSSNDLHLLLDNTTTSISDGNIILSQLNNYIYGTGDLAINGSISFVQTDGLYGSGGSFALDGLTSVTLGASSTVNYAGAAQTITTNIPYANLTLSGSGTKTPDAHLAVNDLTLAGSSVLTMAGFNLSVAGNWTSYSAAAFTETGTTVFFLGTQTLNTTGGEILENVTLQGADLTLTSTLRVNGLLTLTSGTLNSGGLLTLNLATGKIPGTGTGSISGTMNVIQSMTQNKTHYIGSPLAGVTAAQIADEYLVVSGVKSRLLDIDCSTNKFYGIYDMSTPIAQGDAYSMFIPTGTGTLTFSGTYNHAGTGYSSSCSSNNATRYFFAGNPYPSNLDLDGVTTSGTTGTYYILNNSGTYDTYSSVSTTGTGSLASGYVAPMQGFQVQTNGLGGTASVTFPSSARDVAQPTSFVRLAAAASQIRLKASNSTFTDETIILFTDDATNGFELGYDATKMMNTGSAPNLYTVADTAKLVINSLAQPEGAVEIPLNLVASTTTNYTLSFANQASFDPSTPVSLIFPDGTTHDLVASPTVTVSTNPAKPYILKVGTTNLTTATANATSTEALKAWMNDETLNVTLSGKNIQTVEVYDVVGNKIMSGSANSDTFSKVLTAKGGIYIVKVISGNDVFSTKVLVK